MALKYGQLCRHCCWYPACDIRAGDEGGQVDHGTEGVSRWFNASSSVELDLPLELLNALLSIKRVDLFNEVNTFLGTYAVLDMVVFLKRPFYRVLVYAEKAGNES